MAWNEPGNNGKDPDPWSSGGRRSNGGNKNQGPPDIDEAVRNLLGRLGILGGGKRGGSGAGGAKPTPGRGVSGGLFAGFVAVALVVWGFLGFYIIDEAEEAVVLRFGRVLENTVQPGLHWNPPLIDEVNKVNVSVLNDKTYQNRAMLTTDENIIDIAVTVQYRIQDPMKYVIAVQNPELSLDNASESAIRHVVGSTFMDQILTDGRDLVAAEVHERLQDYMDLYNTGIFVSQVNVVDAQPPENVREAFDDVIRAREDEQRVQNQAQQYANRIIPEARGEAQRQIEQANAYKEEVIAKAEGDASRFNQLFSEYEKAPEVTRKRMYIDSIQDVMTASSKIMIDVEGGNNMLYVPLDKILEQNTSLTGAARPRNAAEWRDLAEELAPYLPDVSGSGTVDASRLNDVRSGVRP